MNLQWSEGLSPAVLSMLSRALAFDPADRYQSASELRDDLRAHIAIAAFAGRQGQIAARTRTQMEHQAPASIIDDDCCGSDCVSCCSVPQLVTIQRQAQLNRLQASSGLNELEHVQSHAAHTAGQRLCTNASR